MSKKIGYARVSTTDQHLDLQLDELRATGVEIIYEEHASGKSADRAELTQCLKALRTGDTLVVWRLDRLGRNLADLLRIVNELDGRGVSFRSLRESIDTSGPAGKLIFHLFGALAQFEREVLRERTIAGLCSARARGRNGGRPKALTMNQAEAALALMRKTKVPISEICRQYGVSRSTLYNYAAADAPE